MIKILLIIIVIIIVILVLYNSSTPTSNKSKSMIQNHTVELNRFIWENLGQHHNIDPKKRYLVYYQGMFAPPTRGHYEVVERFASYPNVEILIEQIGSKHRHGVPYRFNKKVWEIYIKELLPSKKIHLKNNDDFNISKYMKNVDVILIVRGNESDITKDEKRHIEIYKDWIRKYDVDIDFLFIDRNMITGPSTSKFIKALLDPMSSEEDLRYFLPKGLSSKTIHNILNLLITFPLKSCRICE